MTPLKSNLQAQLDSNSNSILKLRHSKILWGGKICTDNLNWECFVQLRKDLQT